MEVSSLNQLCVFGISVFSGMLCGAFFDFQRVLRKKKQAGTLRTVFEDIIFSAFCSATVLGTGYFFDNGEIRYYLLLGCISGGLFYCAFFSRFTMDFMSKGYDIVSKTVVRPVLKLMRMVKKPVSFLWKAKKKIGRAHV